MLTKLPAWVTSSPNTSCKAFCNKKDGLEEGNLILDSVDFECTICGTENEVEIKPHLIMKTEYLDGNDYSYEEEVTCSLCGVSHSVGFSFEE